MGGTGDSQPATGSIAGSGRPAVVRQKTARQSDRRVACSLVLDRMLSPEETARFYRQVGDGCPAPLDFVVEGRVVRYECERDDEARWRLAFEIYFVKTFRDAPSHPPRESGTRARAGFRKLHLG